MRQVLSQGVPLCPMPHPQFLVPLGVGGKQGGSGGPGGGPIGGAKAVEGIACAGPRMPLQIGGVLEYPSSPFV